MKNFIKNKSRPIAGLALAGILMTGASRFCMAGENATVFENGKWMSQPCIELSDIRSFEPSTEVKLDEYGGWMEKTEKATGFFHTAMIDGRWWLIDPDGHFFLSVGIDSVSPSSADSGDNDADDAPALAVPGEKLDWGGQTLSMLREHGFNTLGCWSATQTLRRQQQPMPYCLHWNFMAEYRAERKEKYPAAENSGVIYPFDPEFEIFCDQHARGLEKTRNDPWLLGHFSDNELPFSEKDIVKQYLNYPPDDPCHEAAAKFMASRGHDKPARSDDKDFLQLVVGEYYRKVAAAIKKHDPNHLFLGSRFHGLALSSSAPFAGAGPYTDVVSVNYYHRWTPENARIQNWARLAGKPVLITEWYAKAADSGLPDSAGAGFPVKTQGDRAEFYQNFTLTLLQNPACVGWHWFKYRDGAGNNPGIVDAKGVPYTTLLDAMKKINTQVYPLTGMLRK
jgi:hypothetical protein